MPLIPLARWLRLRLFRLVLLSGRVRGCGAGGRRLVGAGGLLLTLLAVTTGALGATDPYRPTIVNPLTEAWRWRHFPELDGTGIRCIAETADRRVFVGCSKGVMEYDGYDWTPHRGPDSPAGSPVEQLLVTPDGYVYATNQDGIHRFDGEEWTQVFDAPENWPFNFAALKQLSDGSLMACSHRGFVLLRAGRTVIYSSAARREVMQESMPDITWIDIPANALTEEGDFHSTSDVLEDADGMIWLALTTEMESGRLLRFPRAYLGRPDFGTYEVVRSNDRISLGADQRLLEAADGRIWVINSSSDRGIMVFDGADWETIHVNQQFGGDEYMTDIVQSDNGIIWISTIAKLFSYSPDGSWAMYKSPQYPIPANRVLLQKSQSDQLWLAGYKSKLLLLDFSLSRWLTYDGLSYQLSDGPTEDWFIESDNRVVQRRGDTWTAYGTADGLMDAPVRLLRTSRGQLWAAGSHGGKAATALYRDGRWERQVHPTLSWGIDYRAVFEASDGALWFGGSVDARTQDGFTSGLLQLADPMADQLEWTKHTYGEDGLNQANVYGIGETPDGRIWIGGSKLMFYDGERWQAAADERLQQYVNYVHSTDNLLLVGSRYFGVFVYDGAEWRNYTTADGLSGNTIISIDALSDSTFIVATENGTCAFDGTSWTRGLFPEKLDLDFEGGTVTHSDAYLWIDHVPRSWKRRALNGSVLDPEQDKFYSTRYQPSVTPPETSIAYYTERIPADGNGIIAWEGKDFFGKTNSDRLVYSYRLDGGPWGPYGTADEYAFTGLGDGPHRLEVRARDLDLNVDPTPAVVSFEVLAPIWKQGWFIGLIALVLLTFGFYEYRVHSKNAKLETMNASLQDRNEEIRRQRDKLEGMLAQLENLSKAKIGFFTNISHELRTPLTLILGPIDQLVEEKEGLAPSRRQQLQVIVQRNARRLLRLIDQLLEIRRIEQSALEIKLSDVSLAAYLADITELFEDLSVERDIFLQFSDETEAAVVALDTDKVEKILANLLSNAFRHTPPGGSISVCLETVSAEAYGLSTYYDRYFEITVEDTGSGMSAEKIALIFDKYYTSPSEASTENGTGIGLSYIKDLVYLMQGDIRVSSTPGSGSTFRVYLPYVPGRSMAPALPAASGNFRSTRQEAAHLMNSYQQEASGDAPEPVVDPGRERILVVEDNPDMLQFLAQLLRDDYTVVTADNGKDGLRLARQQSFDLVLSDIMMGEMDGITLCDRLKGDLETSHVPVILLTAKVLDETKVSGYLKGADDYITKPFNPDLLLIRIKNLLAQRQRLRDKFNLDFQLTPETEELTSPDEEFMNRLSALLQENVSESDFNVKAMCEAMHLSHMHFIRKVKQLTGKKPIDLLKSYRMKMAKELLAQDSLTVAEVAYRVGFDLPNSFSRTFKKEFKMTPTQYVRSVTREEEQVQD
ncbi:response regulator [Lewinella sp. IMCC34183]|uniref:response regulator n=1 Tax=Lewinella sp. IMCC34183 TaxID=2248762 RepID=UPI000E25BEA6|nr:response regulator [Lewinella sp. IMCC34183]